jgi:hypothetical protein
LTKKQFITDEEIGIGGSIQKLVFAYINISGSERARSFWEERGGKETARKTFRRKQQAAQNAMKLAFRGKYKLRKRHSSLKSRESRFGEKAVHTLFGSLVSPSQEAFTMLLYRNGYQKWVWMHNVSVSSGASEGSHGDTSDGFPEYVYTARSSDLTSRNGGWSRTGMLKYNDLYKQVKKDRLEDNGAYDREYIAHYMEKSKNKRKRRRDNEGQLQSLTVSDDIGDLLGALETQNDAAAGGSVAAV